MPTYRVGSKRPINIYRLVEGSDEDEQIGVIWVDDIAEQAVALLNAAAEKVLCTCYTVPEFDCPIHGA